MTLPDRILLGPGPSLPYPEAVLGMQRPMLGHLDPEFLAILDECCTRLRTVWRTANAVTLPLSGTGSAGMEAAFVNWVSPGTVVVIAVNGLFGERMCDVAARCAAHVIRVDASWGAPIDPVAVAAAVRAHRPAVVAVVHAETSTGVRNDVEAIAAIKEDALLLTDCVTSLGGIPVEADGWGIDIGYSGTQKCLGVPPGLAPITVSPRAWDRRVDRPQSWYLDLGLIGAYTGPERRYHHTAPISMVCALWGGLGAVLDEGLEAAWQRHEDCGVALQKGLVDLGLDLFAAEGYRLPQLTSVRVPDGVDDKAVRSQLLRDYNVEIGSGVGPLAGRIWRIGLMGHSARKRNVTLVLGALAEILGR